MQKQTYADNIKPEENIKIYRHLHTADEPLHTHEFFEIAYIYSGGGCHCVNDKDIIVQRGDLMFMGSKDTHSFTVDRSMGVLNCLIGPDFFLSQISTAFDPIDILMLSTYKDFHTIGEIAPVIKFSSGKFFEIESIFDSMENEFALKNVGYVTAIKGFLQVLLVKIFRQIAESDSVQLKAEIEKIIPKVLVYIEENYNEKISVEELARNNFFSPTYFSKIFKKSVGKSPMQFIAELRVSEAVKLITNTDMSIEEISFEVGYNDKKQFYKIFKEYTGKKPNDFRH